MNKPFKDYYAILGITQTASDAGIRKAYLNLIRIHHPDKNPNQNIKQLDYCKAIIEAYDILSDPTKRKQYDRDYQSKKFDTQTRSQHGKNFKFDNEEKRNQHSKKSNQSDGTRNDQKERSKPYDHGFNKSNHGQKNTSSDQGNHGRRQEDHHREERKHKSSHQSYNDYQENQRRSDRSKYSYQSDNQDRNNYSYQNSYQDGHNYNSHNDNQHQNYNFQSRSRDESDLYEVLGLRKNASKSDIKRAFEQLSKVFSADSENPEIRRQYINILNAYIILSDKKLRASYDGVDRTNDHTCSNYGTFQLLDRAHFDDSDSDIELCLNGTAACCLGCGCVLYVISKWTIKLLCIIVPPLATGLVWLVFHLVKGVGWSLRSLFRLMTG